MSLNNITCKLGVSKVHGIGVFTLKDVKKGDKMYLGELNAEWYSPKDLDTLPEDIKRYIIERWPSILDGSDFLYPFDIFPCYLNGSDKPNYDPITDTSLKDIKKGKEVFESYGKYKQNILGK